MITIKNLYKSFGDNVVLKDIDLQIEHGDSVGIIGPSGIGKSTLLRLICGLIQPDLGELVVLGKNYDKLTEKKWELLRLKMGFLFQSAALFDSISVFDNVALILREGKFSFSESIIRRKVCETLSLVGMVDYQDSMPGDLSGGQRKRVGLARAFVHDPDLVLYDEPTTGLDPMLSYQIENLIVKLNRELSITSIVVTHQLTTIFRTIDKVYYLKDARLIGPEVPSQLKNSRYKVMKEFVNYGLK
tara:strand:+ start:9 stop:740 length:732 start_codon:yes stop_codon:yes gene_type:complete